MGVPGRSLWAVCMGLLYIASAPVTAEDLNCPPSLEAAPGELSVGRNRFFPRAHLFQPLIADPKEPRFFLSYRQDDRFVGKRTLGVIGFGETFSIYRRVGDCVTEGWQLDVSGGGVARFDMEDGDKDLISTDFLIALPFSRRWGNWSMRSRIYHESSHFGESGLVEMAAPERNKRSYNSVDFLSSYDDVSWRLYGGVEYVFLHHPEIEPWGLHAGSEYYGSRSLIGDTVRWITGVDLKVWEEFDFDVDASIKSGLSFGGKDVRQHHLQVLLEWYDGHANEGVLFEKKIRYLGVGIYFGF